MPSSEGRPFTTSGLVDYARTLDCIRCGLCLQTCPTFRITGSEASSPRGRIHLMRAAAEGRIEGNASFAEEIDYCLLCLRCESMCPAGVRMGEMMEFTRAALVRTRPPRLASRLARWIGFRVVLPHRFVLRLLGSLLRLVQRTGTEKLVARLFGARFLGTLGAGMEDLPRIAPLPERRLLPERTAARGEERATVALLEGCVMPEFFPAVNRATVDSLAALGVSSLVPRGGTCCGSLHAHHGDLDGARRLARETIGAFETTGEVPIVVNSAGCGAHMRTYPRLFEDEGWRTRAERFVARVHDYSEYTAPLLADAGATLPPGSLPLPATWDDPCHLCHGQGIRTEPRAVLDAIGGLERVELPDSEACCGSGGIYSLLRPEDGRAVFARKREEFAKSGAKSLITANPGCQLQWTSGMRRAGLDIPVVHLAEVVARSLSLSKPALPDSTPPRSTSEDD